MYSHAAFDLLKATGSSSIWRLEYSGGALTDIFFVSSWTYYRHTHVHVGAVTQPDRLIFTLPLAFVAVTFEELVGRWNKLPPMSEKLRVKRVDFVRSDMEDLHLTRYDATWLNLTTCELTGGETHRVRPTLPSKQARSGVGVEAELDEWLEEVMEEDAEGHGADGDGSDLEGDVGNAADDVDDFAREREEHELAVVQRPSDDPLGVPEHVMVGTRATRAASRLLISDAKEKANQVPTAVQVGMISLVSFDDRVIFVSWEQPIEERKARECRCANDNTLLWIIPRWCPLLLHDQARVIVPATGLELVKIPEQREPVPPWLLILRDLADMEICLGPLLGLRCLCVACTANEGNPAAGDWSINTGRGGLYRCSECLCISHADCAVRFDRTSVASVFTAFICPLCASDDN